MKVLREAGGDDSSQPEGVEKMEVEESGSKVKEGAKKETVREKATDGEEVKSKHPAPRPQGQGASGGVAEEEEEGDESDEEGSEGEGNPDGETPQYLARLLSELITGVADPDGPHRPNNKPKGDEVKSESQKDSDSAKPVPSSDKPSEAAGPEEGEGRSRTFAERYAGPEGTTVTISAAAAPPFGIPGLPPMEGPSLSIKNRGEGSEPEVSGEVGNVHPLYVFVCVFLRYR